MQCSSERRHGKRDFLRFHFLKEFTFTALHRYFSSTKRDGIWCHCGFFFRQRRQHNGTTDALKGNGRLRITKDRHAFRYTLPNIISIIIVQWGIVDGGVVYLLQKYSNIITYYGIVASMLDGLCEFKGNNNERCATLLHGLIQSYDVAPDNDFYFPSLLNFMISTVSTSVPHGKGCTWTVSGMAGF